MRQNEMFSITKSIHINNQNKLKNKKSLIYFT